MPILHYIYDPLCGWCYGASPLLAAAHELHGLVIHLHGGGLMNGVPVTAKLREYVLEHDQHIAIMTGVPFGSAYFEGLLEDHTAILSSTPPITAILVAEEISNRGLGMLQRLQYAHYVEGQRISDPAVLLELGTEFGLPETTFQTTFSDLAGPKTIAHISNSRALLAQYGGRGFPAFILETAKGRELLDTRRWLNDPEGFATHLETVSSL